MHFATLYKARHIGKQNPCAICVDRTRGRTQRVSFGYGVEVWLCAGHASVEFLTQRSGRDVVVTLSGIWHVEWVTHTDAPFIPAAGEIVHLSDPLSQPAGGGAVTAAALVRAGARVSFFTAAADDVPVVEELERLGIRVLAAPRPAPHTRCLVMRDRDGERTICVIGENLHPTADDALPWDELGECDGVYFTGGDP